LLAATAERCDGSHVARTSYASVAAKDAPPEWAQPKPDPALQESIADASEEPVNPAPDVDSKVNGAIPSFTLPGPFPPLADVVVIYTVVPSDFKEDPHTTFQEEAKEPSTSAPPAVHAKEDVGKKAGATKKEAEKKAGEAEKKAEKKAEELKSEAERVARDVKRKASELGEEAKEGLERGKKKAHEWAEEGKDELSKPQVYGSLLGVGMPLSSVSVCLSRRRFLIWCCLSVCQPIWLSWLRWASLPTRTGTSAGTGVVSLLPIS
jgi:hypothetical protein